MIRAGLDFPALPFFPRREPPMCLTRPPPALLPTLLLLGALGVGVPLATAAPPPPPTSPVPIEIEPGAPTCEGLWNHDCEEGLRCVDDPSDSCDRSRGDTDCPGVCVAAESAPIPAVCRRLDETRRYVSHEAPLCALLLFSCGLGEQPFFDVCGCGCERTP